MPALSYDPLSELGPASRGRIYAELRERMPVYKSSVLAAWVLTRYADVSTILRHPDALAFELASFLRALSQRGNLDLTSLIEFCSSISLLTRPPRHEPVRRMLTQALGRIWRMNLPERLELHADQLLASGERQGVIDLAAGYGCPLALFVIGTFFGVPEDDLRELGALARDLITVFERVVPSVSTVIKLDKAAAALIEYFVRLIASRRQNSGDDGTSLIVRLADEYLGCSDQELAGYCTFFFVAAEETTASAISGAALILLQRQSLRARLSHDPSQLPNAVGEMLRLLTPVQWVARQLRIDVSLEGQLIRAGEPIVLMLGAANRDPAAFSNPDEPVLDRNGPESLVFAAGPYRCIGAQLATFEVELAIRKLLEKPHIRLSSDSPVWTDRRNIAPLLQLQACFG
ncbi:MAG TPA: cytochrome P450 [Candidatus Sulfotelmatobacter sp.]|nr:cytochrome P450 [Candidatus Sulfotelmatobacter sp.]